MESKEMKMGEEMKLEVDLRFNGRKMMLL
ncbi:hypothetical protein A2U01_0050350, partial [Trifolium medium]|nr:hypothetical protein [Trifolium medium]